VNKTVRGPSQYLRSGPVVLSALFQLCKLFIR